jgi:hypothetical protein
LLGIIGMISQRPSEQYDRPVSLFSVRVARLLTAMCMCEAEILQTWTD